MATKTPKLGTARFTRTCPACGELIHIGDTIANQRSRFAWVHQDCYFDPRAKKADDRLKDAFFGTVKT